ncbi:LEAF RUST 10 DISEASE-RESISTANCE LOCUS RECEPTOR-LIKE PROTEIN KINASE-like 2.4 [Eucalyptus grandis]|uniref:LEAF RUST 10 DISEASE-RESISTANCE LOCUS RECEPTOR-LIKE PROTEIN KINASE-like 2.4 n=1 Tax=Eucalyptus grandis TaxID=71139 RepID=UPI00192E8F8E|nr:LEAF RUST 10 DISEASE-RESISTANCE LOCUS RECEPTOR-LIKE PROTEIN KINASE-like 2.4 [Eucalyptus grandis]
MEFNLLGELLRCQKSGGNCGGSDGQFRCSSSSTDYPPPHERAQHGDLVMKVAAASGFGIAIVILVVYSLREKPLIRKHMSMMVGKREHSVAEQKIEELISSRRYAYKDIKRITNSFQEKLGQGGYGYVYKGKLRDGQLVAVKLLKNLKGGGEEFINEVASISKTSHVNVVSLLGFCFEGSKRALVYEFMTNGSLEKFIFKSNISEANQQLSWETLYNISLGIAQGLEYLHRGCNARILHFDIKPHNILLGQNYCPKISDFGLAKICPREESTVLMLGVRGTAGYIAPELVIRGIGGVSHKSDAYSYGMMVMEMVSGRKNTEVEVDHTSEIYFPHWIHRRLGLQEELGLHGITNGEDKGIAKKMIIISLWCIQIDPRDRPAMTQVMEMLKGSVEDLPIPPKPTLSSPSSKFPVATTDNSSLLQFGATSTTV